MSNNVSWYGLFAIGCLMALPVYPLDRNTDSLESDVGELIASLQKDCSRVVVRKRYTMVDDTRYILVECYTRNGAMRRLTYDVDNWRKGPVMDVPMESEEEFNRQYDKRMAEDRRRREQEAKREAAERRKYWEEERREFIAHLEREYCQNAIKLDWSSVGSTLYWNVDCITYGGERRFMVFDSDKWRSGPVSNFPR
jgi:hypothetical protein